MKAAYVVLALVVLPCIAFAQFLTDNELKGLAAMCEAGHPLTKTGCSDCVYQLGGPTSPIQVSGKAWSCHGLCQKDSIVTPSLVSSCLDCIASPDTTVYGCQACLEDATAASIGICIPCITSNPLTTAPQDLDYLNDAYYTACAACSKMTDSEAQDQCLTCISTWDAKPQSEGGILTRDELLHPVTRPNNFGTCVSLANNTQNINTGNFGDVTGMAANCVPDNYPAVTPPLSPAACVACIDDVSSTSYPGQPSFLHKEFGCYSYCQKLAPDSDTAATCVTCLTSQYPMDAWACGNCLNPLFDANTCFSCVESDPYQGRTSNYNWACGQCSSVADPVLRALCLECIQNQPKPDFSNPNAAATGIFNKTTEANICSCIDLTINSTIAINRTLNAMERACFEPHVYYDSNGVLQTPPIPWGSTTNADGTTSACLGCLAVASVTSPDQGLNKKYGCTEYCQDPRLVDGVVQGEACATCVAHPLVADPSGCKMCMEATTDNRKREICYSCVEAPNSHDNKAWGCSQCAMLADDASFSACFRCMALGADDPCVCVEKAKNGTLTSGAPQATCQPNLFRVWVWVRPSTPFDHLEWSLDTPNAMGPSGNLGGTHLVGGVSDSSYFIFRNNYDNGGIGYDVFGLDLPFEAPPTGLPVNSNNLWLSLYKAVGPGGNEADVFWDWSQVPAPKGSQVSVNWLGPNTFPEFSVGSFDDFNKLAYQLVDSCGNILVDTITRTPYENDNYEVNAWGVFQTSISFSYGMATRFAIPQAPPTLYVVTVYEHCMGYGSLGWNFRLGPGVYDEAALTAIPTTPTPTDPFAGSKRYASSFLMTVPGYQVELFKAGDCSGTPLVITDQVKCLVSLGDWNDQLGCLKVTAISG